MYARISLIAVLLLLPFAATAQTSPCPDSIESVDPALATGAKLSCQCPATLVRPGDVWGTGVYTADSHVCTAAIHAGAHTAGNEGDVTLTVLPGCDTYKGSTAHGITSQDYEGYARSFMFDGFENAEVAAACHTDALPGTETPPTEPPPPGDETPPGDDGQASGLGWKGTVVVSNDYTYEFDGVQTTLHGLVTYTIDGGHYTAQGEYKYVTYVPPSATSKGWARLTVEGSGSESGDVNGPIAVVGEDRRGGLSLPSMNLKVTRTSEGASANGEPLHLVENAEIALPDASAATDDLHDLPLSGTWSGTFTPKGPENPVDAAMFKPWTIKWNLSCSSDCVSK